MEKNNYKTKASKGAQTALNTKCQTFGPRLLIKMIEVNLRICV